VVPPVSRVLFRPTLFGSLMIAADANLADCEVLLNNPIVFEEKYVL
jgi:hypothetical protein